MLLYWFMFVLCHLLNIAKSYLNTVYLCTICEKKFMWSEATKIRERLVNIN